MSAVLATPLESTNTTVNFQTQPSRYKHWRLNVSGDTARLVLDIAEDGGIRPGYKLKLNSYDLGVDIELYDALNRIRFEHPAVKLVVLDSAKERIWCSGANIYMLGLSSHAWKVNFCKFTNETRNGMEDSSRHDGLKFLAAVTGACAGGGYELALACDRILMVDDRSSTVSLPEVPLLGVLPGTGGLTRLMDKRRVRRDLADIFCLTSEGVRADRAKKWRLIDELAKPQQFAALTEQVGDALKAESSRNGPQIGIQLPALEVQNFTKDKNAVVSYINVLVTIDTEARHATITVKAPVQTVADTPPAIEAAGASWWPLASARELDDAILQLRTNWLEIGTWIFKTEGSAELVLQADSVLQAHANHWLVRETRGMLRRTLARLDVSSRSMIALIEPGSCFVGSLLELVLAADRSYMLDAAESATLVVSSVNFGNYPTVAGVTRLATRYNGDSAALFAVEKQLGEALNAANALALGLVTATPDDIDWDDEIRLMLEERASLSPDALTGLEASLRFNGAETMETRIFARLSAWQNWIFNRPNAVGETGALKLFGTGKKAKFDWKRV